MTASLRVTYQLTLAPDETAEAKARDIALEQTVELPADLVEGTPEAALAGRVEALRPLAGDRWRATVAYPLAAVGDELPQLLNLLFGNISLKAGILIIGIDWPRPLCRALGGPGHGIDGVRALTGANDRAMLATALKPMGLCADALAERCEAFARGGVDIVKDDHGLANQPDAPFAERLAACAEAIERARRATGSRTLYFPNVTAPRRVMMARAQAARDAGCVGVLVNPMTTGLDAMADLRDELGLAVMAHPSLTGAFFAEGHGIAPELLLGDIFRLAGADTVIYPNAGGRFGFSEALCEGINDHLRRPLHGLRPTLPTPGGGIAVDDAGRWADRYGRDTLFLIGGSLYASQGLEGASRRLLESIRS